MAGFTEEDTLFKEATRRIHALVKPRNPEANDLRALETQ